MKGIVISWGGLLDRILDDRNLQRAYDRVCANAGSAGVDGIGTDGLLS